MGGGGGFPVFLPFMWNFGGHCFWPWKSDVFLAKSDIFIPKCTEGGRGGPPVQELFQKHTIFFQCFSLYFGAFQALLFPHSLKAGLWSQSFDEKDKLVRQCNESGFEINPSWKGSHLPGHSTMNVLELNVLLDTIHLCIIIQFLTTLYPFFPLHKWSTYKSTKC